MDVGLGVTLQPEWKYLGLLDQVLRDEPDYFEVTPECLWRPDGSGLLEPNDYSLAFDRMAEETGCPLVAHGVGISIGDATPDAEREAIWLAAMARDHKRRPYLWYTDHLGPTRMAGKQVNLPIPLPPTEQAAACVRRGLAAMQTVVPDVGIENSVFYFHLGAPSAEAQFLQQCLSAANTHLLLDLHNLYTTAVNTGMDSAAWLDAAPLDKVIEIHVSGGSWSPREWLPSKQVLRLDSHDDAIPEEVWTLLDQVLPRCPNLRGLTIERMESTVEESDVPLIAEELRRARRILQGVRRG